MRQVLVAEVGPAGRGLPAAGRASKRSQSAAAKEQGKP